ncbi:flagellar biosynthesis protein FlhB [Chthonobacter rhizosphaerae]|uniref:flagellar biosynthesis protein FlhB n=1 Tax=Chthonobacter rhizosphaerae TaxID=2735553 RepID=UPI0015EF6B6C|nr:flagellar biosynthesis protein FlhB [Chthonobacter rhizosphaerae]
MAEGDDSDKTEEPTQRKLDQALEQGDVAKSQEVVTFFTLAAVTLIVWSVGNGTVTGLVPPLRGLLEHAGDISMDGGGLRRLFLAVIAAVGLAIAAPVLLMMLAGIAGHAIQHRLVFSTKTIQPRFSKVSPLQGLKRLFSPETLANFVKGLIKLALVGGVMLWVLWPERQRLAGMVTMDPASLLGIAQAEAVTMLAAMLAIVFLIGIGDLIWSRQRWHQRQRMSMQEIKEEYKQTEGDPAVKAKIKQIRMERSRRRMMAAVPTATVVVTNPTHYAVALKYEEGMQAPVCVAKGTDAVALKIREVATAHQVSIVENPPLARALYATVELDELVPEQHYKAVAEVIGFVMNLKKKASWRG